MSFKDLGLSEQTIQAIEDLGYQEPTTVQKDVIPSVLAGKDIFTIAPAACGKTCSYIFPLIDIISKKEGQNILIISADSKESVNISDKLSIFNKYHEISETTIKNDSQDSIDNEANVIIASPDLLLENIAESRVDISNINILVVDDINLIKKKRQLENLNKVLEQLPANKQNIVFTTRRSKETQDTLDKILKTPAEIKIDKNKEKEVNDVPQAATITTSKTSPKKEHNKQKNALSNHEIDKKALELAKRHKVFGKKTPSFLLTNCKLATETKS
ncbi:MAG: DEAD/DEAH box helicase [Acetobacter sp.]|nr:DEAD/DEAH box helicase [Acetobacter sp.]